MMTPRRTINFTICSIHLGIFIIWLIAWEQLFTKTGYIIWGSSVLLGAAIFILRLRQSGKSIGNSDRLLGLATILSILLAVISVFIGYTVASMP
ncbi:hypothetical protein SAMN05421663_102488 [Terribacillus halophilus]|uniref:Uncharacterized protein n=2 Tax=Terribacillus halophilus TaxID=361279 RepID=A0A1G6LSE6_9BACI|nr:hypothetical protein SAMN05421663_102488 [Terribacillus halophilus]